MKKAFIEKGFAKSTERVIGLANGIIEEYMAQGYTLTLRQLYYQLVARGHIANKQKEYKRLGRILGDARLTGRTRWDAIEDRTRDLRSLSHWSSPAAIVRAARDSYRIDKWESQEHRVEVWVEKDALASVIGRTANRLDVAYFSTRGYPSLSEMYTAGRRLRRYIDAGQLPVVLHLADHDPSGIDMTRDIRERLTMFGETYDITVERIALNMDQVELYNPPPNPAKESDSRHADYVATYGESSWELDALEPQVLDELITDQVLVWRDDQAWEAALARETEERDQLAAAVARLQNGQD